MIRTAACALAAWLGAMVSVQAQDRRPEATGAVTGTVTLSSTVTTRRPRVRLLYAEFGPEGAPRPAAPLTSEMATVVVYLDSAGWRPGGAAPSLRPPEVVQRNETFLPHVCDRRRSGR